MAIKVSYGNKQESNPADKPNEKIQEEKSEGATFAENYQRIIDDWQNEKDKAIKALYDPKLRGKLSTAQLKKLMRIANSRMPQFNP